MSTKLIACKDCGHMVSKSAAACPNCGKLLPNSFRERQRRGFYGFLVILAIVIIVVCIAIKMA